MPKEELIDSKDPIILEGYIEKFSEVNDDKLTIGSGGGDESKLDHGSSGPHNSAGGPENVHAKLQQQRAKLLATGVNAKYCNKFLIAYSRLYASLLGRSDAVLPDKQANDLIAYLEKSTTFIKLKTDGKAAKAHADRGELVIAALRGSDQGHVMIVVEGPGETLGKERKFYPNVMGGGKGAGYSGGDKTAGKAWTPVDRLNVKYYLLTPKSAPAPKPEPKPEPKPDM